MVYAAIPEMLQRGQVQKQYGRTITILANAFCTKTEFFDDEKAQGKNQSNHIQTSCRMIKLINASTYSL